ncbi:hypothetical protein NM688_g7753 [Phlebia brevispora]|uniref:Uncharacterized protein n=1 Tax=Phlebia brevispora TaxID=194682 RepID=A0ACC1S1Q6_9APHY|nr:hypothetical protein NM688_g7753 [Phlebia brevispora]
MLPFNAFRSVKDLASIIGEKGFLRSLVNAAETLDRALAVRQQRLSDLEFSSAWYRYLLPTEETIRQAAEENQEALSRMLASSENSDELMAAIQKCEGSHRTRHAVVVLYASTPHAKDVFLHKAAQMLHMLYDVRADTVLAHFVISSFDVDFDLDHPLGQSASGKVYEGTWNGTTVAIKRMRHHGGHPHGIARCGIYGRPVYGVWCGDGAGYGRCAGVVSAAGWVAVVGSQEVYAVSYPCDSDQQFTCFSFEKASGSTSGRA